MLEKSVPKKCFFSLMARPFPPPLLNGPAIKRVTFFSASLTRLSGLAPRRQQLLSFALYKEHLSLSFYRFTTRVYIILAVINILATEI